MCKDIIYPEEYVEITIARILRAFFMPIREVREEGRKGVIHCVCCVCGVEYGVKECPVESDGMVTHGYCEGCGERAMREIH